VTDTYRYSAFGEIETQTGSTVNSYLYTGQQFDSSTGLYSLRARYYDAAVGRFLSRDTWAIDRQNPMELNRYVYAAGNPVRWGDPSGNGLFERIKVQVATVTASVVSALSVLGDRVAIWLSNIYQFLYRFFARLNPYECVIFELATGFNIPGCGSEYQGAPGGGGSGGSGSGTGGNPGGGNPPVHPLNVGLGLRVGRNGQELLQPWADRVGAITNRDWIPRGLAEDGPFVERFNQALNNSTQGGGRILFNLDDLNLDTALRRPFTDDPFDDLGVTNWELQAVLRNSTYYDNTDFYIGNEVLTPQDIIDFGLSFIGGG
jgi:RHS repeat-associated protein